jgi:hypothetical protein
LLAESADLAGTTGITIWLRTETETAAAAPPLMRRAVLARAGARKCVAAKVAAAVAVAAGAAIDTTRT